MSLALLLLLVHGQSRPVQSAGRSRGFPSCGAARRSGGATSVDKSFGGGAACNCGRAFPLILYIAWSKSVMAFQGLGVVVSRLGEIMAGSLSSFLWLGLPGRGVWSLHGSCHS